MTRRQAERAVVEAARNESAYQHLNPDFITHHGGTGLHLSRVRKDAVAALDALPAEPDLDALNAAVAEAADIWLAWLGGDVKTREPEPSNLFAAIRARRAALRPKPRYEVNALGAYDHKELRMLRNDEVAAMLNAKEETK